MGKGERSATAGSDPCCDPPRGPATETHRVFLADYAIVLEVYRRYKVLRHELQAFSQTTR